MVVRPRRLEQVEQVLGIAQIGKVGFGNDQNLVGADQRALGPPRPLVRKVEHDAGHGGA